MLLLLVFYCNGLVVIVSVVLFFIVVDVVFDIAVIPVLCFWCVSVLVTYRWCCYCVVFLF